MLASRTLAPGIFQASGFISPEAIARVLAVAESLEWTKAFIGYYRDDALVKKHLNLDERDVEVARFQCHFDDLSPDYSGNVSTLVAEKYGIPDLVVDGFFLSRYTPGSHIKPHSDTGVNTTSRVVTCVQYFNDEYLGGNIQFPQFGLSVRPNPGDLLLFYSEYVHAIEQVTDGVRYSMVSFARTQAMLTLPRLE